MLVNRQPFQTPINYMSCVFLLFCVRRKYLVSPSHRKYRHLLKQNKMVQLTNYRHSINLMSKMQQIHGYGIPLVPHRFMCAGHGSVLNAFKEMPMNSFRSSLIFVILFKIALFLLLFKIISS